MSTNVDKSCLWIQDIPPSRGDKGDLKEAEDWPHSLH